MSATRDRVMGAYPNVIVVDITMAAEDPIIGNVAPPRYKVYDKRLDSDPTVTATQATARATQKTNANGPSRGNANGDTSCGWWFGQTQAQIDTNYP